MFVLQCETHTTLSRNATVYALSEKAIVTSCASIHKLCFVARTIITPPFQSDTVPFPLHHQPCSWPELCPRRMRGAYMPTTCQGRRWEGKVLDAAACYLCPSETPFTTVFWVITHDRNCLVTTPNTFCSSTCFRSRLQHVYHPSVKPAFAGCRPCEPKGARTHALEA